MNDLEARLAARRIADQLMFDLADLTRRRGDSDGMWEPPGDLADYGDGTALLKILRRDLLDAARAAVERAEARADELDAAIDADVRRRVPGYQPRPAA